MVLASVRSALALVLLAAPALAQQPAAPAPDAPATAAVPATPDTVVATVNGRPVTFGDMLAVRSDLPQLPPNLPAEILYDGIRGQLVNQALLAQAAEADGLPADAEIARIVEIQRQGLLAQFYLRRAVEARMTDAAVQAAYDARIGAAPAVREVRASHILVSEEAKAVELRAQIEGGADFAELAKVHGTDGTKAQGGDLGYFTRDVMVAEFADAAFAMEVGQVSQPVKTQFGWHLIKLTDARDQPKPALEDVRAELEQELSGQIVQEIVAGLTAAATVSLDEARPGMAELGAAPAPN